MPTVTRTAQLMPAESNPTTDPERLVERDVVAQVHGEREGQPSVYSCPQCGGVLWQASQANTLQFRCHVGHALSAQALFQAQRETLETSLWSSIRGLGDVSHLARQLAREAGLQGDDKGALAYELEGQLAARRQQTLRHFAEAPVDGGGSDSASDQRVAVAVTSLGSIYEAAIEAGASPQLLFDRRGRIVAVNRRARVLLGVEGSDTGVVLRDPGLTSCVPGFRAALDVALTEQRASELRTLRGAGSDGEGSYLVRVLPLEDGSDRPLGVSVTFEPLAAATESVPHLDHSEMEEGGNRPLSDLFELSVQLLETAREELSRTNDELRVTNEELRLLNEEMLVANCELETMTADLHAQAESLAQTGALLEALLDTETGAAALVDANFQILAWSVAAEEWSGLAATAAVGRDIRELPSGLPTQQLTRLLQEALTEAQPPGSVTLDTFDRPGGALRCRLTCTPVRGRDGEAAMALLRIVATEEAGPSERER
jgi:PAS domain S-box-containing protein